MNEYDFSCKSGEGGGIGDGEDISGCKDITWAKKHCEGAKENGDCEGVNRSFFEEYCPKTCQICP